jgi:hypothetical protein
LTTLKHATRFTPNLAENRDVLERHTYQDAARGASDRDHHGGRSCDGGRRTHAFARARTG